MPIVSNCGHIDYLHQHKLIGDNHLLIATYDELFLLKIDYKSWKVNIISKTDVSLSRFFIDQLNDNNFSTYDRFGFITGSLIGDEIVLNPRREFNLDNFILGKLVGNNLIGFRDLNRKNEAGVDLFEFCKIDLSSLTEEKCEVPLCLANNRPMPKWDLVRILILLLFFNSILERSLLLRRKFFIYLLQSIYGQNQWSKLNTL